MKNVFCFIVVMMTLPFTVLLPMNVAAQSYDRLVVTKLHDNVSGYKIDRDNFMTKVVAIVYNEKGDSIDNGGWWNEELFCFSVAKEGGRYRLQIKVEGYDLYTEDLVIRPFKKAEEYQTLHDIKLKKSPKTYELNGAVVKASKVKLFYRGDTLVYNADAFETAEGSMLDDLVRKLPGVELREGGLILVNGRKVDALLLNGEHIFSDRNEVLLENLPNYMVKELQVYEKESMDSKLMGRDMGNNEYVMNVRLKRQYCKGFIGNVEFGYGSAERYLARLFGLRFTDSSRISIYSNFNNLNDDRKPGENSNWTPDLMPRGLTASKKVGLDYLVKEKYEKWKLSGNLEGVASSSDNQQASMHEEFLPAGSLFTKAMARNSSSYRSIIYNNELTITKPLYYVILEPQFSASRSKSNGISASATFNINPEDFCKVHLLDSIRQFGHSNLLRSYALNRVLAENKAESWRLQGSISGISSIKFGANSLWLDVTLRDESSSSKFFAQTLYDYPSSAKESDYRNKYIHDKPNKKFAIDAESKYYYRIDLKTTANIFYQFKLTDETRDNEHNILNRLTEWAEMGTHALGTLPSETDFRLTTIDAENSYQKHDMLFEHIVGIGFHKARKSRREQKTWFDKTNMWFDASVDFMHNRLNYYRGNGYDQTIYKGVTSKSFALQKYYLRFDFPKGKQYRWDPILKYNLDQTAPSLLSMLDGFSNTSDPLNIFTGNKGLKVTTTHSIDFNAAYRVMKKNFVTIILNPNIQIVQNAQAYGSIYDPETGIRHYRPENVNGNYRLSFNGSYSLTNPQTQKWDLEFSTITSYMHGVDLISTQGNPQRSVVNTIWNAESVKYNRKVGKHTIGAKATFGSSHSSSERDNFCSFTLYDINYGLTGAFKLPWGLRLSTDLTMYSRRGYADKSANTNDLVWNARVSKTFPKSNITILLDGFDILNQLSNVTQIVNSQGRTETYNNALPNYIMAHVIYRLNKKPKKK